VTIPVAAPVTAVTIASPDAADGDVAVLPVPETAGDGTITVTLPSLEAYSVVIVSY